MKKCIACIATLSMILAMAGCNSKKETEKQWTPPSGTATEEAPSETTTEETKAEETTEASSEESTTAASEETSADASETSADASASEGKVLTYEEYKNAALDSEVIIEAYVQAKQS